MKIQFLLYVIILGLVINLLADMIWKYIPRTNHHIDKIVTGVLVSICVLLLIFYKEEGRRPESSQQIKYVGRIIDSKTQAVLNGAKVSLEFQGAPPIVYTDSEGIYRFAVNFTGNELPGRVRVEAPGYQIYERHVELASGKPIDDIRLTPITTTPSDSQPPSNKPSSQQTISSNTQVSQCDSIPVELTVGKTVRLTLVNGRKFIGEIQAQQPF